MEETLEAAIERLFKGTLPLTHVRKVKEKVEEVLSAEDIGTKALRSLEKAREALRKEDFSGFGRYLKEAEDFLKQMKK